MSIPTLFLTLAVATALYAQSPYPPPGRLADLGGHKLHVWCTGTGSPTVIVETGLGDFSFDWLLVQHAAERFTRICTYDRAGYAWSDPGPKPRTFAQLNLELHDALAKLGERGPFVLVGHSYGGGVVRNYAAVYRSEVAGMVLVDIVHEDQRIPMGPQNARIRDFATGRTIPPPRENLLDSDRAPAPAPPPGRPELESIYKVLPQREQKLHLWAEALPSLEDAEQSQRDWSAEYMAKWHQTGQDGALGDLPLIVLTRATGYSDKDMEQERLATQGRLVNLSSHARQVIVASGHNMHLEAPDRVTSAIREIVESVRSAK